MIVLRSAGPPEDDEPVLDTSGLESWDWIRAALVLVGTIVVAYAVRRLVTRLAERAGIRPAIGRLIGRFGAAVVVAIGLVYTLSALEVRVGPLLGALGVGGIALAFALQDILSNLVAGLILQARNQFRIGDQVMTNEYDGTVHDITLRTVVLDTYDGERVVVPSAQVLQSPLVNHTAFSHRRTTVRVGVGYGTDLATATEVLVTAVAGVEGVMATPPPAAWADTFGDSSIEFAVWFWHRAPVAEEWKTRHGVVLAIHHGLADAGIEIPFPQRVVHVPTPPDGESSDA